MSKTRKLTPREERFCKEYVIDLSPSKAAIRAGFAKGSAGSTMKKPGVKERINELLQARSERTEITADRVLQELFKIMTSDFKDAYDSEGRLLPLTEMPEHIRKCISGIDIYKDFTEGVEVGETKKIKLWDKLKAAELLGKHLKLWTEKVEHSGQVTLAELVNGSYNKEEE